MKLYIVTRGGLPPGAVAAQSVHAAHEFEDRFPEDYRVWREASNTLVLLSTEDGDSLHSLLEQALEHGIPVAPFYEPDLDDELTAIAIGPQGKRLCRKLRLALG